MSSPQLTADLLCGSPTREQWIGQVMADYESPLIGYAASLLHDLDLARDVVQDTFLRLCQQDRAKVEAQLKGWLFTVCRNRAMDILRQSKRQQSLDPERWEQVVDSRSGPDQHADSRDQFAQVMKLLGQLSANQRECILLKFHHGLSYREIEDLTGLSSGNIGFLIHTGLQRLRAWLAPLDSPHNP